jgi:hypothetical protein
MFAGAGPSPAPPQMSWFNPYASRAVSLVLVGAIALVLSLVD